LAKLFRVLLRLLQIQVVANCSIICSSSSFAIIKYVHLATVIAAAVDIDIDGGGDGDGGGDAAADIDCWHTS
jgi:hypothetical protein